MLTRYRWGMAALAAAVLVFAGCGATADRAEPGAEGGEATQQQAITGLRFMVPNTPGSGYDTTAREAAKVIEEAGAIVVAKNSKYNTITDLVNDWKANPKGMAVGGGSSPGGPDHLLPMQLAQTVGIEPKQVNFISYDGGGELLPAVLGGKVAFGASG